MISIRGAISVEENSAQCILANAGELLEEIIRRNDLKIEDIVSILFTCTRDLDKAYPAVAARKLGIVSASLMCVNEMYVEDSMEMCLRVMVSVNADKPQKSAEHVYLKEAARLRPDLAKRRHHGI